jgi:hypothetical protein
MMRRLLWLAVLLPLLVSPEVEARRRAVTPGGDSCSVGTLLPATYASFLAADADHVYLIDEMGALARVPRLGGERQELGVSLDDWFPLGMVVDDTTVYISVLPFESIFTPLPGAILAVPKSGGVATVVASGVATAFALEFDATHLYWAAAGILDFDEGGFGPGGKIERMKKDGSERQTLADDLSAPLSLVLDGADLYFGESGLVEGDESIGLYHVPAVGGPVTTIHDELFAAALAMDGDTLVISGAAEEEGFGILAMHKSGATPPRLILEEEALGFNLQIADHRAYVMADLQPYELLSVDLLNPGPPVVLRDDLDSDAFVVVDCAVVVNTYEGAVVRTRR